MTKPLDPYSRVYWRVLDDERFDEIRSDMRHFGSWTLMLVVADMAYPVPAFVPSTVPKASLVKLSDCGLIERLPGGLYRVHGMKSERERRSPKGTEPEPVRNPSGPRPAPDGTLARAGVAKPSQDETSRDAPSSARAPDPADVYWTLTGRYPTDKVLGWVDDLAASYGSEAVIRALATTHAQDSSTSTLLGRTQDVLRAEARALNLKEQAAERQRQRDRQPSAQTPEQKAAVALEIRRLMGVAA